MCAIDWHLAKRTYLDVQCEKNRATYFRLCRRNSAANYNSKENSSLESVI